MSGEKAPRKQSFLQGVAVLTAATIIVKLLGFIYKVPLQNILQERGFGYFNTAYDVYNVLLMISTTGLPVAVSRMISQAQALENYAQIRKIYSVSMKVFLTIGVIGTLVMLVFCKPLSVMVTTNENSWAAIAALSPCVLLICIVSAHRGFFQGQSNMTPTSVSQVYEAMIRVVFGLGGAYLMLKKTGSLIYAAAGGIFGVTAGCIVAVVYLRIQFGKSNQILRQGGGEAKSTRQTMKELLVIAIPIGILSACRQNSLLDRGVTVFVYLGFAMPSFWLALLLMLFFGIHLQWLPISGLTSMNFDSLGPVDKVLDLARHLALPILVYTIGSLAGMSRYMRACMLEVLRQDYILTAQAKGLSPRTIIWRHALRNALLPVITLLGLSVPGLIGGSVIIESIFALPGLGQLFYAAVMARDYTMIMGNLVLGAVLTLLGNLLADVCYGLADPRIRSSREVR